TPFVGEQNLGSSVVERRGMPEGVVRVADRIQANGVHGIRDIQKDSVARTGASSEAYGGVDGDVMAAIRFRGRLTALTVIAAFPEAVGSAGLCICENARARYDFRQLRMRERDLDYINPKKRRIRVGVWITTGALAHFFRLANRPCAGDVYIN